MWIRTILPELFLAWRYFKPKRNAVSVITLISVIGVALGVAVLIVVLAVMTGFTDMMKEKLLETTAHIFISPYYTQSIDNPEKIVKDLKSMGLQASPVVRTPVLVQKKDRFIPKMVIGIDPFQDHKINVKNVIQDGKFSLNPGEVILSSRIARELGVRAGDKILLHSPAKLAKMVETKKGGGVRLNEKAEQYLPQEYLVSGEYLFGKYDFDKNVIFLGLDDAGELKGLKKFGSATDIFVWTEDPFNVKGIAGKIQKKYTHLSVQTWKDVHKQLLGVLTVEKKMMMFLLVFIVLVASFSITNTLITTVIQKTREIGLLKALGASSWTVTVIFVLQGFLVGVIGTGCGFALGLAVVYWRNELMHALSKVTGIEIFPAEFYFFNELPGHIVGSDLIVVASISIVLCTIGGIIPALRATHLDPAKALRYE